MINDSYMICLLTLSILKYTNIFEINAIFPSLFFPPHKSHTRIRKGFMMATESRGNGIMPNSRNINLEAFFYESTLRDVVEIIKLR